MLNRRHFLRSLGVSGAALLLPPTLADTTEEVRRFWSLDRMMMAQPAVSDVQSRFVVEALRPCPGDVVTLDSVLGIYRIARPGDCVVGLWNGTAVVMRGRMNAPSNTLAGWL